MKRYFLTILIPFFIGSAFSQTTLFKDNLFDTVGFSVEVVKYPDFKVLKFDGSETDSVIVYSWKYELVSSAFSAKYAGLKNDAERSLFQPAKIQQEAGRIFYKVETMELTNDAATVGPLAGTLSFEGKSIIVKSSAVRYKKVYRKSIKKARKIAKSNNSKLTKETAVSLESVIPENQKKTIAPQEFFFKKGPLGCVRIADYGYSKNKFFISANRLKRKGYRTWMEGLEKKVVWYDQCYHNQQEKYRKDSLEYLAKKKEFSDSIEKYDVTSYKKNTVLWASQVRTALEKDTTSLGLTLRSKEYLKYRSDFLKKYPKVKNPKWTDYSDEELKKAGDVIKFKRFEEYKVILKDSVIEKYFVKGIKTSYETIVDEFSKPIIDTLSRNKKKFEDFKTESDSAWIQKKTTIKDSIHKLNKSYDDEFGAYNFEFLRLRVDSIEVEITKTFIENIAVYGEVQPLNPDQNTPHKYVTFFNHIPLGISTMTAIDYILSREKLYCSLGSHTAELNLKDVMAFYRPKLKSYRMDLSPADTSFTVTKSAGIDQTQLRKTPTNRLFEIKVYSDFIGLDGTSPNGLVQTELSKEMYLNSRKFSHESKLGPYFNYSYGSYITPSATVSKLENNSKYYPVYHHTNDSLYATTVQLKRFELFSVGADLNFVAITIPKWKTQFYLDPGVYFGRVGLVDSVFADTANTVKVGKEFGVNSIAFKLTTKVVFQTDERYFFDIRTSLQWYHLLDGDVNQIKSYDQNSFGNKPKFEHKLLYHIGLNAGFSPTNNTKGKIFLRYNYYGLATTRVKQGFSQIQLGYSYYFIK